ncbi:hypothetical protein BCU95_03380 [Vibrio splendidus]|nr:hypothetical protein BCU95_03380 [Vibrio splendidus]
MRNSLVSALGTGNFTVLRFLLTHGYWGKFVNPISFNEKIQNRKLYEDPHMYARLVDKYHVREYVSSCIGEKYLIPLLARFEILENKSFDIIPDECVIKTSNGGGGVNVKIFNKKFNEDFSAIANNFNTALKDKIGEKLGERFYDILEPSILVESKISNLDRTPLLDYKFHVFNSGEIFLQINSNYGKKNETKTLYSLEGVKLSMQFSGYNLGPDIVNLPDNFDLMLDIASKLGKPFSYVRVDLYNVDGKVYFGELTFCPASGWDKFVHRKDDFLVGSWWL